MTLAELLTLITESDTDDWNVLPGPMTYRERITEISAGGSHWNEVSAHRARAIYTADIDVGLVWGMPLESDGAMEPEEWLSGLPDNRVARAWLEVLYRGQPVHRDEFALVDALQGYVPWPRARPSESGDRVEAYEVTRDEVALVNVIARLEVDRYTEDYVSRCGFVVIG